MLIVGDASNPQPPPANPIVKPSSVVYRIAVSALTRCVVLSSAALAVSFAVGMSNPLTLGITAIACLIFSPTNSLIYEGSLLHTLAHNKFRGWQGEDNGWYHHIKNPDKTDSDIYLGGQPYLNWGHYEQLKEHDILSLLEPHEFKPSLFTEPVTPEHWDKLPKTQKVIKVIVTPDFNPLSQKSINDGVKFIESARQRGKKVYIHCKAGKGRSAATVICYFIKNFPEKIKSVDEAIAHVKKYREVININKKQRGAIETYFKGIRNNAG